MHILYGCPSFALFHVNSLNKTQDYPSEALSLNLMYISIFIIYFLFGPEFQP